MKSFKWGAFIKFWGENIRSRFGVLVGVNAVLMQC